MVCRSRPRDACVYETHTSIRKDTWPKKRIPLFRRDKRAVFCAFRSLFVLCIARSLISFLGFLPYFFLKKKVEVTGQAKGYERQDSALVEPQYI